MESISLLPLTREETDVELAYAFKRDALGPHVVAKWGWDEAQQRETMREKVRGKAFFRIVVDGETVGTIAFDDEADGAVEISEFYIPPAFQRRGIGSRVLRMILSEERARSRPVRLQCLKWNPACNLYRRHGFRVVAETEHHFVMERSAAPKG
jgi:ribosomal protein S18 acetylase RimI-like enzyme